MDYSIHAPKKIIETGQVFEITNLEEKQKLSKSLQCLDSKWGCVTWAFYDKKRHGYSIPAR